MPCVHRWPVTEDRGNRVRCVRITQLPTNNSNPMLRGLRSVWSYDKAYGQRDGFLVLGPGTTNVRVQLIPFSTSIVLPTLSFSFESFFFLHEPLHHGWLSLRFLHLKTRDGLKRSIPLFSWRSRYVNHVIRLVIIQSCV
jgi:hypothetical protein